MISGVSNAMTMAIQAIHTQIEGITKNPKILEAINGNPTVCSLKQELQSFGDLPKGDWKAYASYGKLVSRLKEQAQQIADEVRNAHIVRMSATCPNHGLFSFLDVEDGYKEAVVDRSDVLWASRVCPYCAQERTLQKRFSCAKNELLLATGIKNEVHSESTLWNYQVHCQEQEKALLGCQRFALNLAERINNQKNSEIGIFLKGSTGCGKSHLALGIYNAIRSLSPVYLTSTSLFGLYRGSYKVSAAAITEILSEVSCLIVDEVGRSSNSSFESDALIEVLDARKGKKLPTILISNLEADALIDLFKAPIMTRIWSFNWQINANWANYRLQAMESLARKSIDEIF